MRRLVLVLGLAACGEPQPYACDGNADCRLPDMQGVCTNYGFCAFEDTLCPLGLRYHESAGDLAGICVGDESGSAKSLAGDTAANPLTLQPMQTIDLSNANDDYTPSCGGGGGRDVFLQTQITARSRLYIDTKGSDFAAVLVIAPGPCTAMTATSCVSGACAMFDQWSDVVSPGTYCVVVDQQDPSNGNHLVLRSMLGPAADEVDFGMLSGNTCEASDWKGVCTQGNTTDQTWFAMTCEDQPVYLTACGSDFAGEIEAWGLGRTQLACGSGCSGLMFTIPAGPAWLVAADAMSACGTVRVDFEPN